MDGSHQPRRCYRLPPDCQGLMRRRTYDIVHIVWTPDRMEILAGEWASGIPAIEIGHRMGITKNAVIGKVHRMGLTPRKVAKPPVDDIVPTLTSPQWMRDLIEAKAPLCRWPIGDPRRPDFRFCGAKPIEDRAYCPTCQRKSRSGTTFRPTSAPLGPGAFAVVTRKTA